MRELIKSNWLYFLYLLLFAVFGGISLLFYTKGDEILFFNVYRVQGANEFFRFATRLGEYPVFVVLGLLLLAYKPRYSFLVAFTGIMVTGLSHGLKMYFAIDRPAAFFEKLQRIAEVTMVDSVDVHTGATSFPSGHTMSAFAIYSLLIFILPKKKSIATIFFLLALLVGLSRIFLVQHFWPDVYAGALIGSAVAIAIYLAQQQFEDKPKRWLDRPAIRVRRQRNIEP